MLYNGKNFKKKIIHNFVNKINLKRESKQSNCAGVLNNLFKQHWGNSRTPKILSRWAEPCSWCTPSWHDVK